jgi:hypothetical protein
MLHGDSFYKTYDVKLNQCVLSTAISISHKDTQEDEHILTPQSQVNQKVVFSSNIVVPSSLSRFRRGRLSNVIVDNASVMWCKLHAMWWSGGSSSAALVEDFRLTSSDDHMNSYKMQDIAAECRRVQNNDSKYIKTTVVRAGQRVFKLQNK